MNKNKKEALDNNFAITRAAEEVRKLSFNDQICLGCGVCESTCPVEAITLNPIAIDARHRRSIDVYFSGHEKIAQNFHAEFDVQKISPFLLIFRGFWFFSRSGVRRFAPPSADR